MEPVISTLDLQLSSALLHRPEGRRNSTEDLVLLRKRIHRTSKLPQLRSVQCPSIQGLMVSISWYMGHLKGRWGVLARIPISSKEHSLTEELWKIWATAPW